MPVDVEDIATKDVLIAELQTYLGWALEWIDAVPKEAIANEAMPGFGRDDAEAQIRMRPEDLSDGPVTAPSA